MYDVKASVNTNTSEVVVEVDCDDASDNSEDERLLNQNKMMYEGGNKVCGKKVDVGECSGYSEVLSIFATMLKKYSNFLKRVKTIVHRYRYVVKHSP